MIVGTGVGGATLGFALAQAGKRVVFVEKGRDLRAQDTEAIRGWAADADPAYRHASEEGRRELLARGGRASEPLFYEAHGGLLLPEIGCGTGGSSGLFGMVLQRFFPSDFEPRQNHPDAPESTLPERWPVSYAEMEPWYEQAERLYAVRGDPDPLFPRVLTLPPPPPLSPGGAALFDQFARKGLHPYRLPLACENLPDCTKCQGYLCPKACKNDADRVALRPAITLHGARLLSGCEALHFEADRTRVLGLVCGGEGWEWTLRGRVFVVAAGALGTPALLLSSRSAHWEAGLANSSGMVGRNLMRHGIDLWSLFRAPRLSGASEAKSIAFNDLYETERKLGTVQSFGLPPPLEAVRNRRSPVWRLGGSIAEAFWSRFSGVPILASILEDLPYEANRIEVSAGGLRPWRVRYRPGPSEVRRRAEFRSRLSVLLRGLGAVRISRADAPKALGHVCGTCRFGEDPATSVLDRDGRAHALDNLYVADASLFPSSSGTNPALTVAANALRVARHLEARL